MVASIRLIVLLLLLVACSSNATPVGDIPATPFQAVATTSPPTATSPAIVQVATDTALPPSATATDVPSTATSRPPTATTVPPTETPIPETATASATVTESPTETPLPPSATPAPPQNTALCARPSDDYSQVTVARHTINRRTYQMLENAQSLYAGRGSMFLLIQGSFTTSTQASFGTHAGGGAVDIWTVEPSNTNNLLGDIDAMVLALRQAGFAAWYRPADMLYQGMYPHIHAIAIGDTQLSGDAIAQLTGDEGYFRGRAGLPQAQFIAPDPHGGPIFCDWMTEAGYRLMSYGTAAEPTAAPPPTTAATVNACQPPNEDYNRVVVAGQSISQRTYSMLLYAQQLYTGPGDLLWVTQGSYSDEVDASFGTHAGGGAVDISVRHPTSYEFMTDEAQNMVLALRQAGFAAWYRSPDEGFTPHIHAIAIGDAELSAAALEQINGANGYFNGGNALPAERAGADKHGGPLICDWMR